MERGAAEAQWSLVRGQLTGCGARRVGVPAAGRNRHGHTVAVSLQFLVMSVSPGFAVDMDRTGPTMATAAAKLCAGQSQIFP